MNFHKENKYGKLQSVLILKLMHRDEDEVITEKNYYNFENVLSSPSLEKKKKMKTNYFTKGVTTID